LSGCHGLVGPVSLLGMWGSSGYGRVVGDLGALRRCKGQGARVYQDRWAGLQFRQKCGDGAVPKDVCPRALDALVYLCEGSSSKGSSGLFCEVANASLVARYVRGVAFTEEFNGFQGFEELNGILGSCSALLMCVPRGDEPAKGNGVIACVAAGGRGGCVTAEGSYWESQSVEVRGGVRLFGSEAEAVSGCIRFANGGESTVHVWEGDSGS